MIRRGVIFGGHLVCDGGPLPPPLSGAKLGAIFCGLVWTAVDSSGTGSLQFQSVWTPADLRGRRLEIYGSEGWGFESLRAC
jgi:hypothetical protein